MKFILILMFLFSWVNAFALNETDRQESVIPNLYGNNAGFENGIKDITASSAVKNWSTTKHLGNKGASCTTDTTNDYCETKLVCNGDAAANLEWGFWYKTTSTTLKAEILDSSNNVVRIYTSGTSSVIPANTGFTEMKLDYVAAASTCYKLRFTQTTATASTIYWDTMHVSKNLNVGTVAQSEFVGSVEFGTNCQFDRSSTSLGTLGTDATCTATAVGNVATVAGISPAVKILYPKRGKYQIVATGPFVENINSDNASFAIYDGTNYGIENWIGPNGSTRFMFGSVHGGFLYATPPSNLQFTIAGRNENPSGSITMNDGRSPSRIEVYYFPDSTMSAVVADNANQFASTSWLFSSQSSSVQSTSFTALNMTSGDSLRTNYGKAVNQATANDIALKINNLNPGTYLVMFTGIMNAFYQAGGGGYCNWAIDDGTTTYFSAQNYASANHTVTELSTIAKIFKYDAVSSPTFTVKAQGSSATNIFCELTKYNGSSWNATLTVIPLSQPIGMPQITNLVTPNYNGQVSLAAANIGQSGNYSAVCSSSPCGVFNNFGVSGVTRSGTGSYTASFSSGTFSQAPVCTCVGKSDAGSDRICIIQGQSSSSVLIGVYNDAGTAVDGNPSLICTGIK